VLLEINDLEAGYGFLQVLWGVSLQVDRGEFVCLVGPNGAGKSTTLKTIAGLIVPRKGQIRFNGTAIAGLPGHVVARMGISYVSEDMNLFTGMTVRENLAMGAFHLRDRRREKENLEFVLGLFPRLRERQKQLAGTMSGGERKMLAIARGMMASPSLLLVDEPSLGLAPQVTADVFRALDVLRQRGVTLLLVEQNVLKTLQVTNRGYVLEKGRVALQGRSADLTQNDHVRAVFLGV
jgi:branched-chain amino acid transport system ATP-binding protein